MTELRKTFLYDAANDSNAVSVINIDSTHYLASSAVQNVVEDANNSSTTNLDAGNSYTFTGTATSTLGVVGLQWSLKTDKNATIYIDQSPDGTNWDVTDTFDYYYSKGGTGATVQAVSSYWRIRVILTGTTATTYFRLIGILCPMVEALPRALNSYGRLKTSSGIIDEESGTRVAIDPLGRLDMVEPIRLVGTTFSGTTKDINFWTETVTGSGTATQSGEIILSTGSTANSTTKYVTVRKARKVSGLTNQFRTVAKFSAGDTDNIRRIGAYDANDGFFFQLSGTTFSVVSRKAASDNAVSSGSFNGNLGAIYTLGTSYVRLTIDITSTGAKFYVNDILLHTLSATTAALTNTLTLPITMENNNSNGNDTDNTLTALFATILRKGNLNTLSAGNYISTNTTVVLKQSAGTIERVINVDNAGTLTLYDNNAASGTIIGVIDTAKALGSIEFNLPFSNGLTAVTGTGSKVIIVYE